MAGRDMTDNPMIQKLLSSTPVICLPIRMSRSIHILQMAKSAGFDAVYMDMEHSPISLDTVSSMALAAWNMGVTPLVRVPSHDPEHIIRSLEAGCAGVIVPHVHNAKEARAVVDASCFRPLGSRAMAGASPPLGYARVSGDEGAKILNARTIVILMIESMEGVANSDEICAVDGVDLIFVGTGDLSDELGVHGDAGHPKVQAAFATIAESCRRYNKWLGIGGVKGQPEEIRKLRRLGAIFISSTTDETLLLQGLRREAQDLTSSFVDG